MEMEPGSVEVTLPAVMQGLELPLLLLLRTLHRNLHLDASTARAECASVGRGALNAAINASPTWFTTTPPRSSMIAVTALKKLLRSAMT